MTRKTLHSSNAKKVAFALRRAASASPLNQDPKDMGQSSSTPDRSSSANGTASLANATSELIAQSSNTAPNQQDATTSNSNNLLGTNNDLPTTSAIPPSLSDQSPTQEPTSFPKGDQEFSVNLFGTILYPTRWITAATLTSWLGPLSSLAMIIGCVLPYAPQYKTIYKTRSCSGFSTFVCLTLLLSNILRIAFWFGHPFEIPLVIQSSIQIVAQILLLELCVRVSKGRAKRTLLSFNPKHFWRWTDLTSYLVFLVIITALLGVAVYFFIDNEPFIETIGYCALVSESLLGLPQMIRNYRKKSVEGMSLSMVLMWLGGDAFKTGYFIANAVPYQFWLCGITQITIDIIILIQVCLYKQGAPVKANRSMSLVGL